MERISNSGGERGEWPPVEISNQQTYGYGEARTLDFRIMRPTRCQLRHEPDVGEVKSFACQNRNTKEKKIIILQHECPKMVTRRSRTPRSGAGSKNERRRTGPILYWRKLRVLSPRVDDGFDDVEI